MLMDADPPFRVLEPTPSAPAMSHPQSAYSLLSLARGQSSVVTGVVGLGGQDSIAHRLRDIGFVPGEEVKVVAVGPLGAEPLLVQVGYTRFALRRSEAARVQVRAVAPR